jgi:CTP:molybdopterin cytidylyltransferase MocA
MGSMTSEENTVGILLAAGAGSRFTGSHHKLLSNIGGTPIWEHSLEQLIAANIRQTIIVTGAIPLHLEFENVYEVHNPSWSEGQSTSLRAGIRFAEELDAKVAIIGLADQPGITTEAWRNLARSSSLLATATYHGTPGHPVRIAAELWDELPTAGDFGARALLRKYEHHVERIPCSGSPFDIDTTKDLDEWLKQSPTSSP